VDLSKDHFTLSGKATLLLRKSHPVMARKNLDFDILTPKPPARPANQHGVERVQDQANENGQN